MKPYAKYILAVLCGVSIGSVSTYYVTMHYMGKFTNWMVTSFSNGDAVNNIHALNSIREGKLEQATRLLENELSSSITAVAYSKDTSNESSEEKAERIRISKMALEYWSKYPSAEGQDFAKPIVEKLVNGK